MRVFILPIPIDVTVCGFKNQVTPAVKEVGKVLSITPEDRNIRLAIEASFAIELKADDSVSHNGVCLTVVKVNDGSYEVVCIEETLRRSNLGNLKPGEPINVERSLKIGSRLDGHFVQGHVDETANCNSIFNNKGSYIYGFDYSSSSKNVVVNKGSVCINGVSLTVVHSGPSFFSVAIIPYTLENTTFKSLKLADIVNLEFDIIGKYVARSFFDAYYFVTAIVHFYYCEANAVMRDTVVCFEFNGKRSFNGKPNISIFRSNGKHFPYLFYNASKHICE